MTDSPLHALRQCIANLKIKTDKPVVLASVPRQLALRIVGDYAAETQRTLETGHMAALCDKAKPELMFVIDGIPVVAGPMLAPMFALWTWPGPPVGQALREIEENSVHPGLPWFPGLENSHETEMMNWIRQAVKQARELIETRPARYFEPASLYMPEGWEQEEYDDGIKRETLSEDPAIAFEEFKDATERQAQMIQEGIDNASGRGYGIGMRGDADFIKQAREYLGKRFDCHTEQASGHGMTVINLTKRTVTLN